ncbi:DUF6427 family protein [Zunongwangia sp.]|uniref:DUF6427 family protein n=1 Tax=Zunongwangia sp. TaxID=1965325 RepID=UPI003AA999EE
MLTSFFAKSKPINILFIIILLSVFFVTANFGNLFSPFQPFVFTKIIGVYLVLLFGIFMLNFIAKKNELTKRSAYKILLFSVFCASFSSLLRDYNCIVSASLVLLALRRVISLKSQIAVQKKLFDASFWIAIASLFYFWSFIFILVVFGGILIYAPKPKYWLIPIVSASSVAILYNTVYLMFKDQFYTLNDWYQPFNFDFSQYQSLELLVPVSIILALMLWWLVYYFSLIQKAGVSLRPSLNLILFTLVLGILIGFLAPSKNGSELIFFFIPLSIIGSNYFDNVQDKLFREILLLIILVMPIGILFILFIQ